MIYKVSLPFVFLYLLGFSHFAKAQDLYEVSSIQEIRIYFAEDNWDEILDELYTKGERERLLGNVTINGTEYKDVGIRYKGYSSASTDRVKNPFNIDLEYTYEDQNHQGFDKLKLSNVIHDPSFIREVLSYDIAQKYMPASMANFANVYVNDELIGLYTNVESVDKNFLRKHFGSKYNAFIKCNPERVNLNGENSNLANAHGTNPFSYEAYYTLKSNDSSHWNNLYHLIDTLNNYPEYLDSVLNIDQTLWMHALNYTLINFDSYIGYAQNYYLYQADDGRFQPILWDMNQSFASYRLTDASNYWQGFSVSEAPKLDPLTHYESVSVLPRPLLRNIFENSTYRKMFLAHIRTIVEDIFSSDYYKSRATYFQSLIDNDVSKDPNKFYGYNLFAQNIDTTVNFLIDYPGIFSLMDARVEYLLDYKGVLGAPTINNVFAKTSDHSAGSELVITAEVLNTKNVKLAYRLGQSGAFKYIDMYDDGNNDDYEASDNLYGIEIQNVGNYIDYYVFAENDSAGAFMPRRAANEFYTHHTIAMPGDLVINELMAKNDFTIADESDDYDDWVELKNLRDYPVSLKGLYLTNNLEEPKLWALPDYTIPANSLAIIWTDDDVQQGAMHTTFKLDASSGTLGLYNSRNESLDVINYDEQSLTKTFGRYPVSQEWGFMWPTPGKENYELDERLLTQSLFVYPNPCNEYANINFLLDTSFTVQLIDTKGNLLEQWENSGSTTYSIPTSNYKSGIYLIRAIGTEAIESKKIIINRIK